MNKPITRADLDLDELAQDAWSIEAVIDAIIDASDSIPTNAAPFSVFSLARLAKSAAARMATTFSDIGYAERNAQEAQR